MKPYGQLWMMVNGRIRPVVAVFVVLAVGLAGCGTDGNAEDSGQPEPTERELTEAKIDTTRAKLIEMELAVERFELRFNRLPTEAEGLQALLTGPANGVDDYGRPFEPLLRGGEAALQDAWDNELNYEVVEEDGRRRFYIWSNGPSGNNDNREGDDILPRPW